MSSFSVITSELSLASGMVDTSRDLVDSAATSASRVHGALGGTPAASSFETLIDSIGRTSTALTHVAQALSAALASAASSYQAADDSATASLSGPSK
jgi:uncharacterized protein YukE